MSKRPLVNPPSKLSIDPAVEPCLEPQLRQRRAEQAAFDARLGELLAERLGQWAVFAGGQPIGFFDSYGEAFAFGLVRCGAHTVFLVARVEDPPWRILGLQVANLLTAA